MGSKRAALSAGHSPAMRHHLCRRQAEHFRQLLRHRVHPGKSLSESLVHRAHLRLKPPNTTPAHGHRFQLCVPQIAIVDIAQVHRMRQYPPPQTGLTTIPGIKPRVVQALKAADKSCAKDASLSRRGEESPPLRRCRDLPRGSVCRPPAPAGSPDLADGVANRDVSSDQNRGLFSASGRVFQPLLALEVQDQFNRGRQTGEARLAGLALAVGFWHFGAEGNELFAVALDHRGVAISHAHKIRVRPRSATPQ